MTEHVYTVAEAFKVLKQYKITSNIESIRRWLRQGELKGNAPTSRKTGWTITQTDLDKFIASRMPDHFNTTNDVKENTPQTFLDEAAIRADERDKMWHELRANYIVQDYIEIKKSHVKEAIEHRRYNKNLLEEVWQRLVENNAGRGKKVSVYFLLDAISFEGQRIMLDKSFATRHEQALYPIIEYVRSTKLKP